MPPHNSLIEKTARQIWMGLLARADASRLALLFPDLPDHSPLRPPQVGTVMLRGRIGGVGQPFNLGEMIVTRCSICLSDGSVGHANVQGRNKTHALRAAAIDALMQTDRADTLRADVLTPLAADEANRRGTRAAKAAATRVEFFTLVRGEDQ